MTRANAVSARCDDLSRQAGPTRSCRSWLESVLWRSPLCLAPPLSALVSAVGNRKPYAVHRLGWLGRWRAQIACLWPVKSGEYPIQRWVTPPPFNSPFPHPPPPPPRLGLAEFPPPLILSRRSVLLKVVLGSPAERTCSSFDIPSQARTQWLACCVTVDEICRLSFCASRSQQQSAVLVCLGTGQPIHGVSLP